MKSNKKLWGDWSEQLLKSFVLLLFMIVFLPLPILIFYVLLYYSLVFMSYSSIYYIFLVLQCSYNRQCFSCSQKYEMNISRMMHSFFSLSCSKLEEYCFATDHIYFIEQIFSTIMFVLFIYFFSLWLFILKLHPILNASLSERIYHLLISIVRNILTDWIPMKKLCWNILFYNIATLQGIIYSVTDGI